MKADWSEDPARARIYETFQTYITPQYPGPDYTALAESLGQKEASLRQIMKRLRSQFREEWMREVRRIVADPAEADSEARELLILYYSNMK